MPLRRAPTLNLPNQLTVLRLGLCGLILVSLSITWRYAVFGALIIFTIASLTDWLDGSIARRYNLVTDLGKLLDPLADKVMVVCALAGLLERHIAPMWMVVLIIAREFLIMGLRQIAAHKQVILAAERVGKHKTISQIVAILVSFVYLSLGEFGFGDTPLAQFLGAAQIYLYWFALIITVFSGAIYFWKNAAMLNETIAEKPVEPAPDILAAGMATTVRMDPPAAPLFPAFKEWEGLVTVLGQGAQIVILRKGGIAEGRAGFKPRHDKFWLFPTQFHQQWEQTKPTLRRFAGPAADEASKDIVLEYFAEVTDAIYLESWAQVARLDGEHFWGETLLRERFDYHDRPGMTPGLHLFIVRVSRINLPHRLAPAPAYEGCKSWIEVPLDWTTDIATPVVPREEFATRRSRILAAISAVPSATA
jgi:CDP-diacylglycerol---glycerol-3-phosphate 3-phosphatidyltransferase